MMKTRDNALTDGQQKLMMIMLNIEQKLKQTVIHVHVQCHANLQRHILDAYVLYKNNNIEI